MDTADNASVKPKQKSLNTVFGRYMAACLLISALLLLGTGAYLVFIALFEVVAQQNLERVSFQYIFAAHLLLSVPFATCFLLYILSHIGAVKRIKNNRARKAGLLLTLCLGIIIVSGVVLTRGMSDYELNDPAIRAIVYIAHIILPLLGAYGYFEHRRRGRKKSIRLKPVVISLSAALFVIFIISGLELRQLNDNPEMITRFEPSLLKFEGDAPIKPEMFMKDEYCQECHGDIHQQWSASAHSMSSFNNPYYNFSVINTRAHVLQRDGSVTASRFCAGCHDPIPLISGLFDEVNFGATSHSSAQASLTCTLCHSIKSVDSPIGNADFTIKAPVHYPFAFSESDRLRWFSNLLIKSNPDFHKETFLKPVHKTTEFCGSCHKVHIPKELNHYRWLRGQNHYDSFLQSGVSGHNVDSFYYPEKAKTGCNECHMPLVESNDSGAKRRALFSGTSVKNHLFASGNTALAATLLQNAHATIDEHKKLLQDSLRIDVIGLRKGGDINGEFQLIENQKPLHLVPGETYLIEVVLRTLTLGHAFTNGTSDSNQIWVELEILSDGTTLGSSGLLDDKGEVAESGTHFVQNILVDRYGQRITERNVEDIYTSVKNHQIPPGASDVIHYQFTLPEDATGDIEIRAALHYRKFSVDYTKKSLDKSGLPFVELPIVTIAKDALKVEHGVVSVLNKKPKPSRLVRLNDYGIGLFRKPAKKQYRQAEDIFSIIDAGGDPQGTLNLVRLYFHEGQLQLATEKLLKLSDMEFLNRWSAEWYSAQISLNGGFMREGIQSLERLYDISQWPEAQRRGFDFSHDYKLLAKLAESLFVMATFHNGSQEEEDRLVQKSKKVYERLLSLEPEHAAAHFGLAKIAKHMGDLEAFEYHDKRYQRYKKDEHAESEAVTLARSLDSYIDQIANSVVIYQLN